LAFEEFIDIDVCMSGALPVGTTVGDAVVGDTAEDQLSAKWKRVEEASSDDDEDRPRVVRTLRNSTIAASSTRSPANPTPQGNTAIRFRSSTLSERISRIQCALPEDIGKYFQFLTGALYHVTVFPQSRTVAISGVVRFIIENTSEQPFRSPRYKLLRRQILAIKGIAAKKGNSSTVLRLSVLRPGAVGKGIGPVMDLLDEIVDPNSEIRRLLNEMACTCNTNKDYILADRVATNADSEDIVDVYPIRPPAYYPISVIRLWEVETSFPLHEIDLHCCQATINFDDTTEQVFEGIVNISPAELDLT
jgi:hypothetical protein